MQSGTPQLVCLLTLVMCMATAGFAQDGAPPVGSPSPASDLFEAHLERRPDARAPARLISPEALRRNQAGAAIICCRPRADRTLECETGWETPNGSGFGRSATRFLASQQQITEASYADYLARMDRRAFPQLMLFRWEGAVEAMMTPPPQAERQALCDAAMPIED